MNINHICVIFLQPGPGGPNGGPQGQYPMGGGPQYPMGGPAQNWSGPGYQQPWQNPHPSDPSNHPNQCNDIF